MPTKTVRESFPAKAIAKEITTLMTRNPDYTNNVWRASNHVLKEWNIAPLQQLDDNCWEKLNKALSYALEGRN